MNEDKQGPIENILDGLQAQSDVLSKDEIKDELCERGIDPDGLVAKVKGMVAASLSGAEVKTRYYYHYKSGCHSFSDFPSLDMAVRVAEYIKCEWISDGEGKVVWRSKEAE